MITINDFLNKVIHGNSLEVLRSMPEKSVDLIITSPPYFGCRVYGKQTEGLGRESHPLTYIDHLYDIIKETHRVLKDEGSIYIIIGDVYFGSKGFSRNKGTWARKTDDHYKEHKIVKSDGRYIQEKQLLFLPERLAIKMQESGDWLLRSDIIWEKPNPIPSHAPDRVLPVHEHILFFSKEKKYYFDYETIKKLNRHRSVIRNGIEAYGEHQATFPESLVEPYILATSQEGGIVMDPFGGSGTVANVCKRNKRNYISIDIVKEYCDIAEKRISEPSNVVVVPKTEKVEDKKENLFESSKEGIKMRKNRKHIDIPYVLNCCKCKLPKKTNPDQYVKQLEKSHMSKEEFLNNYKCRSCRKNEQIATM